MADIFICHVHEDGETAQQIAAYLKTEKLDCWYYERDVKPGPTYIEQVTAAIDQARVILVLVSQAAMGSHQVAREIEYSHDSKKKFLPVLVDISQADFMKRRKDWHLMFGAAATIQLSDNRPQDLERIAHGARALIPGSDDTSRPQDDEPQLDWKNAQSTIFYSDDQEQSHACFSPDNTRLLIHHGFVSGRVELWMIETKTKAVPTLATKNVFTMGTSALSADGRRVVTTGPGNSTWAYIWDAWNGNLLKEMLVDSSFFRSSTVGSVQFSHDGKLIVVCQEDGYARIHNVETGREVYKINHGDDLASGFFSPDDKHVLIASNARFLGSSKNCGTRIWDLATGSCLRELRGHSGVPMFAAYSRDGKRVVTASVDSTARIWDAAKGVTLMTLSGHGSVLRSANFSYDGRHVVTASSDHTIRVWHTATGKEIATLMGHTDGCNYAEFSPDGRAIVSASKDGTIRLWRRT